MTVAPRAYASGPGANDPSCTIPGSVAVGDGMVLIAYANTDCSFTTPSGWLIADPKRVSEPGGINSIVYKRVAQSGDANSSVTVINDGAAGVKAGVMLAAYSGSDIVDPIHAIATPTLDTGGDASVLSPVLNTTENDCIIIEAIAAKGSDSTLYSARPAGATPRITLIGSGGGHADGVLVDRGPVAAGTYGGGTFTADANLSSGVGYTIAVKSKSATQTIRPSSDISIDGYVAVPAVGTGVALSSRIGESIRDDATYIETPTNPTNAVFETRLGAGLDPLSSADHKVSVVLSTAGGATTSSCTVSLVQGTTVIASGLFSDIPDTPTVYDFTLTTGEADSITNYGDLRLRFDWTVA